MRRAVSWIALIALQVAVLSVMSRSARAGDWTYESEDIEDRSSSIVRFSTRFDLWFSTFDRPPRACEVLTQHFEDSGRTFGLPRPDTSCPSSHSSELGVGTGLEVAFRVLPPLYLTAGIDVIYTTPEVSRLKNQLIVPVPFGMLFTVYEWSVRPIVHAMITPILYVTDDARDYTLGGDLGIAFRVLDWGDISMTAGYKTAETMSGVQLQFALHPVP